MKSSVALTLLLGACAAGADVPAASHGDGPVARSIDDAAAAAGVPADLMLAIAIEEGGVRLPAHRVVEPDDAVPVGGALELRHGRLDTLALGARLVGASEDDLRADTDLGTRAGALVLAQLGAETGAGDDLASWTPAIARLSGMDDDSAAGYTARVLALLQRGGTFEARDGERVNLPAHPSLIVPVVRAVASFATPDYPGAIWFDTSCTSKCTVGRPLGNAAVDKIVIHDTEGGWDGSVATLQYDTGKSVHYIVDADGSRVGQFRPETDTTWHAGNYYYNETSIGIEHVGVASDPAGYSDGLYATSRALVQSIRSRWTVPLDRTHIVGHYQVPNGNLIAESSPPCSDTLDACEKSASYGGAGNHRDPGYYWQWCQYMEALGGSCTCNDAYPLWNCTTDGTEAVRCDNGQVQIEQCTGGCQVQPVGTPDVCNTVAPGGPDAGAAESTDGGIVPGGGGLDGGCCATGGGATQGWLISALAVALALRRRRGGRAGRGR